MFQKFNRLRAFNRITLGTLLTLAGVNHLVNPRFYESIMPDYLPWHRPLVILSGYAEIICGLLALIPRWPRLARWGITALLVAVFPANVHMAVHSERYPAVPAWLLWLRLPLQAVMIAWTHWCVVGKHER